MNSSGYFFLVLLVELLREEDFARADLVLEDPLERLDDKRTLEDELLERLDDERTLEDGLTALVLELTLPVSEEGWLLEADIPCDLLFLCLFVLLEILGTD